MDLETLRMLLVYHDWANRRVLDAVERLTPEQFTRDLGSSFPSIQKTLAHMLWADRIWLCRAQGEPLPAAPVEGLTPEGARAEHSALAAQWQDYLRGLDADAAAGHKFIARPAGGLTFEHTLFEVVPHLVNHGSYHRGQIATMLRQLGEAPPGTDLIYFFRERSGPVK